MSGQTVTKVLLGAIFMAAWSSCRSETVILVAFKSQSVTFTCRSNVTSSVWRRLSPSGATQQIFNGTNFLADSNELTIYSVDQDCVGKYSVFNQGSPVTGCEYELSVMDVAANVSSESDVITVGDNVTVTCALKMYPGGHQTASYLTTNVNVMIRDNWNQSITQTQVNWMNNSDFNDRVVSVNSKIPHDGHTQYFCSAVTQNFSKTVNTTKLQVSYPVQRATIDRSNNSLILLDEVINCSADALPPVFQYQWQGYNISSNEWIHSGNGSQFIVETPGILILRCTAFNIVNNIIYNTTSEFMFFNVSTERARTFASSFSINSMTSGTKISHSIGLWAGVGGSVVIVTILLVVCCAARRRKKHESEAGGNQNGISKRISVLDDMIVIENSVYGDCEFPPPQSSDKQIKSNNNGKFCDDNAPVYAEVRNFTVGKSNDYVKNLPMNSLSSKSSDAPLPSTGLTLVENCIYDTSTALQRPHGDNGSIHGLE